MIRRGHRRSRLHPVHELIELLAEIVEGLQEQNGDLGQLPPIRFPICDQAVSSAKTAITPLSRIVSHLVGNKSRCAPTAPRATVTAPTGLTIARTAADA